MRKNLSFWAFFILAILLSIYFATRIVMGFMGIGPTAIVQDPDITVYNIKNYDETRIKTAMGIAPNTRAYSVNLNAVNNRITEIPEIRESAVRRLPNGKLVVHAQLYRAVAGWTDGTYYYPISGDGTIVNTPSTERTMGTVIFRGATPNNISDITKAAMGLVGEIDYLEWIDGRRWNIITKDNIIIMLPEDDPITAIGKIIALNEKHQILSKNLKAIDMRDDARILIK